MPLYPSENRSHWTWWKLTPSAHICMATSISAANIAIIHSLPVPREMDQLQPDHHHDDISLSNISNAIKLYFTMKLSINILVWQGRVSRIGQLIIKFVQARKRKPRKGELANATISKSQLYWLPLQWLQSNRKRKPTI